MTITLIPVEDVAYSANAFDDLLVALALKDCADTQGVVRGKTGGPFGLDLLAVTGSASPVAVASGAMWLNGKLLKNSAPVNVNVPTPAAATRIDLIVGQLDYTAGPPAVGDIVRVAGVEGGGAPSVTQVDGTTWEVALAQVSITTGGVITVTDLREYVGDGQVHPSSLAASVAGNGLSGGAGSALAVNVDDSTIEISGDALRVKDGGIATAKVADDAVDDTKAGNRVPQFYRRQGGSATDWSAQGTTTRTPGAVRMQGGVIRWTGGAAASGNVTVTFPQAFSDKPIAFVANMASSYINAFVTAVSATQLVIAWQNVYDASTFTVAEFAWLAVGPE